VKNDWELYYAKKKYDVFANAIATGTCRCVLHAAVYRGISQMEDTKHRQLLRIHTVLFDKVKISNNNTVRTHVAFGQ
jgi:hypothetical protein